MFETKVYNFQLNLNWDLINLISKIDRFDASWSAIERKEGQSLKQLKTIATVRSVGASTRIEGSTLSDHEVKTLLDKIDITKLQDRDTQEVVGYFEVLDLIGNAYPDIPIMESSIKSLHNLLMKFSDKDAWHRGKYKQHSNAVEARMPDGSSQIIFRTTEAGYPTEDAMQSLVNWYHQDFQTHPLVKCALFAYEFVSIHPFQDGNGRLSRLLSTLLLLKHGYRWIQYVSFEHEIESRKNEYYQVLRSCQAQRPFENVAAWIHFFFDALGKIQDLLMDKLRRKGVSSQLSPRERSILTYIGDHPGCRSGEIADDLQIPNPTVKRILPQLMELNLVERFGAGPGTNYTVS